MSREKLNKTDIYRCRNCGSDKVQTKAWVYPNSDNKLVEYIGTNSDESDNYCDDCGTHVEVMFNDELMYEVNQWMLELSPAHREQVTKLSRKDYSTEEEFKDASMIFWLELTDEDKIKEWRVNQDCYTEFPDSPIEEIIE